MPGEDENRDRLNRAQKVMRALLSDREAGQVLVERCVNVRRWESGHHMNRTILVVEDNDLNLRLFTDLLEAHGYTVLQAQRGMDGLELARARRPDLVVMDIQLPDVSGIDVIRWLKEDDALRAIPVLAVTAFAMKGDKEAICGAGSDAYMAKPIEVRRFVAVVGDLLGETQHDRPGPPRLANSAHR